MDMTNAAAGTTAKGELQIRKLNTQDFWQIVTIIRKGGKDAIARLENLQEMDQIEAGMLLLDVGLEFAQKELGVFFAGIANMTVEEYENASFDTTLSILEQLEHRENLASFFNRAVKFGKRFSKKI